MKLYLPLLFLTNLLLMSCNKECRDKNLPEIECLDGYDLIENIYIQRGGNTIGLFYGLKPTYLINDDSTYNAPSPFWYKPFDTIDFATKTLLGVEFSSPYGIGVGYQSFLCHNSSTKTWTYTVNYVMIDKCDGEGAGCSIWMLCPKIPDTDTVIFEVININPFSD